MLQGNSHLIQELINMIFRNKTFSTSQSQSHNLSAKYGIQEFFALVLLTPHIPFEPYLFIYQHVFTQIFTLLPISLHR